MKMDYLKEFVKPELLVLIPVLYLIGVAVKKSGLADKWIPLLLGCCGVVLSLIWVFSTSPIDGVSAVFLALFTAITQGVLCAGASVFVHQLFKQGKKDE